MIFPIGDENIKGPSKPWITYVFIVANILIFAYMVLLPDQQIQQVYDKFATRPSDILQGNSYGSLMTNMFLHGGILHLAGNMFFMWIFADNIEVILGKVGFVIFYLIGGVFASLAHVFTNMQSTIPSLGASGALAAVMGAYFILFPKSKIKVFVVYLFRNVHISAIWFLGAWFIMQLGSSLWEIGKDPNAPGTAWWAHIGGFVFGVIIAYVLKSMKLVDPHKYKAIA